MKLRSVLGVLLVIALVAAGGLGVSSRRAAGVASGDAPLRKIAEFELPGPPGKRFDYLTIDDDDNYLLSAHLAAGLLHVIDLKTNAVVKTIRDVPGVEGVAYIAEGKKVYTANWGENKIGVVDLAWGSVIKGLPTETKPDGIAYAAPFHKAYVSNERAKAESVIDVSSDTIIKVLRFDSETASAAVRPRGTQGLCQPPRSRHARRDRPGHGHRCRQSPRRRLPRKSQHGYRCGPPSSISLMRR